MPDDLTPTQSRVLDYIATHIVERQRPPTRKDIAAHFGWSSANAAEDVMQVLVRKGFIELDCPDEGSTHWKRYPMGSGWLAYQDRIAIGVMEHKVTTGDKSNGTEWSNTQARVTAKGMARLAVLFTDSQVQA